MKSKITYMLIMSVFLWILLFCSLHRKKYTDIKHKMNTTQNALSELKTDRAFFNVCD